MQKLFSLLISFFFAPKARLYLF